MVEAGDRSPSLSSLLVSLHAEINREALSASRLRHTAHGQKKGTGKHFHEAHAAKSTRERASRFSFFSALSFLFLLPFSRLISLPDVRKNFFSLFAFLIYPPPPPHHPNACACFFFFAFFSSPSGGFFVPPGGEKRTSSCVTFTITHIHTREHHARVSLLVLLPSSGMGNEAVYALSVYVCDIGVFGQGGRGRDCGKGGRDDLFEHTHSSPLLFLILSCSLMSWTDRLTRGALVTGSGRKSTTRSHDDDDSRGPDGVSRERGGVEVREGRERACVCRVWLVHSYGWEISWSAYCDFFVNCFPFLASYLWTWPCQPPSFGWPTFFFPFLRPLSSLFLSLPSLPAARAVNLRRADGRPATAGLVGWPAGRLAGWLSPIR